MDELELAAGIGDRLPAVSAAAGQTHAVERARLGLQSPVGSARESRGPLARAAGRAPEGGAQVFSARSAARALATCWRKLGPSTSMRNGMNGESVEDGGGKGGVAEISSPIAQRDVRGDRGRGAAVSAIDKVIEGVCCSGLVVSLSDLTESHMPPKPTIRTTKQRKSCSRLARDSRRARSTIRRISSRGIEGLATEPGA